MAQYTNETIKFNNVINPSWTVGTDGPFSPYTDSERSGFGATEYLLTDRSSVPSGNEGLYFTTNAIDIHWGGADINGTSVNTTAQLLKIIADLQTKVGQLESAFSTLASNVGTLVTITNE